jgi:hypothetical protein
MVLIEAGLIGTVSSGDWSADRSPSLTAVDLRNQCSELWLDNPIPSADCIPDSVVDPDLGRDDTRRSISGP